MSHDPTTLMEDAAAFVREIAEEIRSRESASVQKFTLLGCLDPDDCDLSRIVPTTVLSPGEAALARVSFWAEALAAAAHLVVNSERPEVREKAAEVVEERLEQCLGLEVVMSSRGLAQEFLHETIALLGPLRLVMDQWQEAGDVAVGGDPSNVLQEGS